MLVGFGVGCFAGPSVGGEDDGEEPVGAFDAPGTVDDARDGEIGGLDDQAGFLFQFPGGDGGDEFTFVGFPDGQVPVSCGEFGAGCAEGAGPGRLSGRGR